MLNVPEHVSLSHCVLASTSSLVHVHTTRVARRACADQSPCSRAGTRFLGHWVGVEIMVVDVHRSGVSGICSLSTSTNLVTGVANHGTPWLSCGRESWHSMMQTPQAPSISTRKPDSSSPCCTRCSTSADESTLKFFTAPHTTVLQSKNPAPCCSSRMCLMGAGVHLHLHQNMFFTHVTRLTSPRSCSVTVLCFTVPAVGYVLLPAVVRVSPCCWVCSSPCSWVCSFSLLLEMCFMFLFLDCSLDSLRVETSFAGALVEELLFDLMPALSCGRRQRRVRGRLPRRTFSSQRAFVCAAHSLCPRLASSLGFLDNLLGFRAAVPPRFLVVAVVHCFLAWCLTVSRHPRQVSLVLIDGSAKLVDSPCLPVTCARHTGAVVQRAPLTTLLSGGRVQGVRCVELSARHCRPPRCTHRAFVFPSSPWICVSRRCTHRQGRIGKFTSRMPFVDASR